MEGMESMEEIEIIEFSLSRREDPPCLSIPSMFFMVKLFPNSRTGTRSS